MTIDIATAREVLKSDPEDDAVVTRFLLGARGICEGYCNRKFYNTQQESDDDFPIVLLELQAARTARDTALAIVGVNTSAVIDRYIQTFARMQSRIHGTVVDDLIEAAILITLTHLYFNREDSDKLPLRAQRILQPKLWIGDIADDFSRGS